MNKGIVDGREWFRFIYLEGFWFFSSTVMVLISNLPIFPVILELSSKSRLKFFVELILAWYPTWLCP